jgi:threonine/homoserine/homoserine lactone efflux protein
VFGVRDLWLFVLSGLLLNITPGPDTLYIVGRRLSSYLWASDWRWLTIVRKG